MKKPISIHELKDALWSQPIDYAPNIFGIWAVRRVYLGRVEDLVPSGRPRGPCNLDVAWAKTFPFHFDDVQCDVCALHWVYAWQHGRERGLSCTKEDPCYRYDGVPGHCDVCRDTVWYEEVAARLEQDYCVLTNGEVDHHELLAVQWLYLERPN